MEMTLVEMLEKNALSEPEKDAILYYDERITYSALDQRVNGLAGGLIGLGVKRGDRVAMMMPRVPELVIGFLAAARAAALAAPVNYELNAEKISEILRAITPRAFLVHSSFLPLADQAVSLCPGLDIKVIVSDTPVEGRLSLKDLAFTGAPAAPSLDIKADDPVYLNYTSGSTGDSKGAITTHANIYWNTLASVDALALTASDVHLCMFASFAHPHEIFARALYLCGTMVLVDRISPKSLAEAVSRHGVTCVMGLAPMYENLLELLEYRTYDLSSLRIPESGGMYTRQELIRAFRKKLGVDIIPVWGSTETTGIAIANRFGERIIPGSIGRPCRSYKVKIVDEDWRELPPGEVGEMIFKGPGVVRSYYEEVTADKDPFRDGWYCSGDLGRKDKDGNFYFVERKTGMMKVAGLKVYPAEIEAALLEHPDVKEVSVIAAKDYLRGEVPKAIIALKGFRAVTEKEILRFCRGRLPHYKVPRIIEFRNELPKTGSGKINKKALQMECA
ncbi:MAG: AMP-binding protein [Deltaproteobacteria bacterium]|nr:AMP-binding protein [Deltaproteobacteria bacterium]